MSECMLSPKGGGGSAKVALGDIPTDGVSDQTIQVTGIGFCPDVVVAYDTSLYGNQRVFCAIVNKIAVDGNHATFYKSGFDAGYTKEGDSVLSSYNFHEDGFTITMNTRAHFATSTGNRWHYIALKA